MKPEDDELVKKIKYLPETEILQLKGTILNLEREILGLKSCYDDYKCICGDLTKLRNFVSELYNASHDLIQKSKTEDKKYFDLLIKAAMKITDKRPRKKAVKILKKAGARRTKTNKVQTEWLINWRIEPMYRGKNDR